MAIERKMSCGKNTYQSSYTFELIDLEFSQSPKVSSFVFKRPTDLLLKIFYGRDFCITHINIYINFNARFAKVMLSFSHLNGGNNHLIANNLLYLRSLKPQEFSYRPKFKM